MAFQVDASKIAELWGSKNTEFLDDFMAKHKGDIEEGANWFEIEPQVYRDCLADIINGAITRDETHHYIYGYIYEMMCRDFGEQIEREEFLSYLSEVTDGNFKAFIPIPASNDWPDIYSIKFNQLEEAKDFFLKNAPDYAAETNYIDEISYIFKITSDRNKDLVFINY